MVSAKRANPALWKISTRDSTPPVAQIKATLGSYADLKRKDPQSYPPLLEVRLRQVIAGAALNLYVRNRQVGGLSHFIADYLQSDGDRSLFGYRVVDTCLFITLERDLFAITSGAGYRVFEDYVDYAFPFDTAKKLIANTFTASDVRELSGPRASRTEIYRKAQSISNSEFLRQGLEEARRPAERRTPGPGELSGHQYRTRQAAGRRGQVILHYPNESRVGRDRVAGARAAGLAPTLLGPGCRALLSGQPSSHQGAGSDRSAARQADREPSTGARRG